jgi:pimeloyl-ACP methyl ester carboxylesterase
MAPTSHAPAVFLPGPLLPAAVRYAPLLAALGAGPGLLTKDLEVAAEAGPGEDYGLATEVQALDRFADDRGLDRFHLYGHSAGASVALAYAAERGDRLLSLALDEPASDFSAADRALLAATFPTSLAELPVPERMRAFAASLVRPGVVLAPPTPPPGPAAARGPVAVAAFEAAMASYELDTDALATFDQPVYVSHGSLSNERWDAMVTRLAALLPRCRVERYDGAHHLRTSHVAEPDRVAASLRALWSQAAPA